MARIAKGFNRIFIVFPLLFSSCFAVGDFVPFVIPAQVNPDSQIQFDYAPITEKERVRIIEGHFGSDGSKRLRFWGVNLSFGANFPAHSDAEQVAKRLACAGVNAVRLHHMDTAKWPMGIWDKDGKNLSPEALDRLDYFIDQLAKHGIYVNLNLHVGKEHSTDLGLPESPEKMDKIISIFTPDIIEAQKQYARMLLTHQNKYRPYRYADDPAIAIVEITNENSLFMWSAPNILPNLPDYYAALLGRQYNQWLKNKYGTMEKLVAAWNAKSIPLGQNLLTNGDFAAFKNSDSPDRWALEQHQTAKAKTTLQSYKNKTAVRIEPVQIDDIDWHLQFNQGSIKLEKGKDYTLTFEAAAQTKRTISAAVNQAHEPWQSMGFAQDMSLTAEWKQYRFRLTPNTDDDNCRVSFAFGADQTPFYLRNVLLQPGVEYQLDPAESLEQNTVKVFGQMESDVRQLDRMMFLAQTEKTYFDGMRNLIKNDLGSKSLVTGTVVFGPLGLYAQSDMDFIDSHAYWQHPHFPGKPWDANNWVVEPKPMSAFPQEATLFNLAAERLAGKPYTVTEYNHPAPMDSQAECVPMLVSFAAAQDWDGLWLYTYSHSADKWNRDYMNSYFDIDTNPAKWGFVPAGAAIFRQNAIAALAYPQSIAFAIPEKAPLSAVAEKYIRYGRDMKQWLNDTVKNKPAAESFLNTRYLLNNLDSYAPMCDVSKNTTAFKWADGTYYAHSPAAWAITGLSSQSAAFTGDVARISNPASASLTMTALDNNPLTESAKILITACGRCENTDMKFSPDRRTVGTNWGKGPVQIEPVEGVIDVNKIIGTTKDVKAYALKPDGTKKTEVVLTDGKLALSAKHETMWYLITR